MTCDSRQSNNTEENDQDEQDRAGDRSGDRDSRRGSRFRWPVLPGRPGLRTHQQLRLRRLRRYGSDACPGRIWRSGCFIQFSARTGMHDLHPVPDAIGRCRVARAPNFPRGKGRPTARVHAEERAESVAHVGHEEVERIERKQRLHHRECHLLSVGERRRVGSGRIIGVMPRSHSRHVSAAICGCRGLARPTKRKIDIVDISGFALISAWTWTLCCFLHARRLAVEALA
jgi:hypothetical protein